MKHAMKLLVVGWALVTALIAQEDIKDKALLTGSGVDRTNDWLVMGDASVTGTNPVLRRIKFSEVANISGMYSTLEPALGNPAANGYVLSSTTSGTRSWVAASNTENVVFEGDSWMAGTAQGNDRETFPYYFLRLAAVNGKMTGYNAAVAGQTAATMVTQFSSQVAPYLTATSGKRSVFCLLAGINDGATRTTTQVRDDLRTMWAAARTAGATVVAFTLPHRTAGGGWSQTDWKTVNTQIVADSSYWDFCVRLDVICSNALATTYSGDGLHATTATHAKIAAQLWDIINGDAARPVVTPYLICNACSTTALSANTRRNLPFTELLDANADGGAVTVGSDSGVAQFVVPVDGKYVVDAAVCLGALTLADSVFMDAWVTPVATGTEVSWRLDFQQAAGANLTVGKPKEIPLLRGDKINISVQSSRANTTILNNGNNAKFSVRYLGE
jgi:lysophospholipase L1-like esterase